jgi:hypothetical protein
MEMFYKRCFSLESFLEVFRCDIILLRVELINEWADFERSWERPSYSTGTSRDQCEGVAASPVHTSGLSTLSSMVAWFRN